jgi:uncharacterized membrane protein
MKFLFPLIALLFSFNTFSQTIELMDTTKMKKLKSGSYEYVMMGSKEEIVIEKKSNVFIDFAQIDVPKKMDSMAIALGNDTIWTKEVTPFLIKNMDATVSLECVMVHQGDTLKFKSSQAKSLGLKVKRLERPVFTDDPIVFGILAIVLGLIFFTSHKQTPFWKKFYIAVPALLLCYLIPAILVALGLISKDYSSLYTMAKNYLLPAALILMTIGIDFKAIINLGPKALIMFFTATIGIVVGGPLAIWIYTFIDPSVVGGTGDAATWKGFATLAGSWIGGGANQTAMLELYEYKQELYGKMITIDIVVAQLWMIFLLWAATRAEKFDKWLKADTSAIEDLKARMVNYESLNAKKPTLTDYMIMIGLTFGLVGFSHWAGQLLAPIFKDLMGKDSPFGNSFFWLVVLTTAGGLIYSATKVRRFEGAGASKLGSVFIYILVATIGMKMDLGKALEEPQLILVGIIWMLIHVGLLFLVAKLIRAPFFFLAVGSKANVGGAASAPVVAAAFHPSLASVGALLAVLGYGIGSIAAMACAEMMAMVAP